MKVARGMRELEINPDYVPDESPLPSFPTIMTTPPSIGKDDYWVFRIQVGKIPVENGGQAVVAFPKFCTLGIGFLREESWNTNLPASCGVDKIWEHIKCNKGRFGATDEECIEAIRKVVCASLEYQMSSSR